MKVIIFLSIYVALLLLLTQTLPFIHAQNSSPSFSLPNPSSDTNTPKGSPLPGNFQITAFFHDPTYFAQFHKEHTGIDLIPTTAWQENHPGSVTISTTVSGIATRYHEDCSGNAVIIRNDSYIEYLGHVARFLVQNNTSVVQGQPVAIMGASGEAACVTGSHVHYQLYKKIGSSYQLIDPFPYLPSTDKKE